MKYQDFEKALGSLETIVAKLEKGDLALEEALRLFEEGIKISRFCSDKLDEAERRVEILLGNKQGKLEEQLYSEVAASEEIREQANDSEA